MSESRETIVRYCRKKVSYVWLGECYLLAVELQTLSIIDLGHLGNKNYQFFFTSLMLYLSLTEACNLYYLSKVHYDFSGPLII